MPDKNTLGNSQRQVLKVGGCESKDNFHIQGHLLFSLIKAQCNTVCSKKVMEYKLEGCGDE